MSEIPARDKLKPALKLLFWIILIAALIAVAVLQCPRTLKSTELDRWSRPLGSRNFIIIYILATILFIPGSLLTLELG